MPKNTCPKFAGCWGSRCSCIDLNLHIALGLWLFQLKLYMKGAWRLEDKRDK